MTIPNQFRIWSFEHSQWWREHGCGYTSKFKDAGIYSLKDAVDICTNTNVFNELNEAMIPVRGEDEKK